MPDDAPEGIVSRAELERLAILFDLFFFAIDPLSEDVKEAERDWELLVEEIFEEKVQRSHPEVDLWNFRHWTRAKCRAFLRKNK